MKPSITLQFNGDCAAAFRFYEQCLPAKTTFTLTWGDSPMANEPPAGFSIALNVDDTQEADRLFGALAAGGQVRMALCETFWARRYGMVVDPFGIPWEINCER